MSSVQLNMPPLLVKGLESGGEASVQNVDLPEIPLQMAKATIGGALKKAIRKSGEPLKTFGDPSQVNRVCEGDVPAVLARAWQQPATRREWILALAEADGMDVEVTVRVRRTA